MPADYSWTFDPGPIIVMAIAVGLYVPRWRKVRRAMGARGASGWRMLSFAAAILSVAAALLSPIDRLGEQAFVMHMAQHLLLLDVAPILFICSLTRAILRPATRRLQSFERSIGPLADPLFAIGLYVAVMWAWHAPALYDAALNHATIHVLEHICFFTAGFLYWWHVLSPIPGRRRLSGMGAVVYMLSTKLLVGILGIGITFAPHAIYAFYKDQPTIWGLTPTEDQQLGGALMALEQSIIMGIALVWLFVRALEESEREEERAERYADRATTTS